MEIKPPAIQLSSQLEYRLTALWALSESGLGGFMHALKIPFTGFFLGGFAIIIIILIAHYAEKPLQAITRATLLVVLVKATASPHSPPMAYLAVGFQGLCGALTLSYIPWKRLGAMLFGFLALFESAVQKFLVTTFIFGKSIWEALDVFFKTIAKDFALSPDFSFSFWLITGYTILYCLWGLLLGWWASGLPNTLDFRAKKLHAKLPLLMADQALQKKPANQHRQKKLVTVFFMLLFVCSVFIWGGFGNKALYALTRTIAALLLLYFIIAPIVKWALKKWINRKRSKEQDVITDLLQLIPELKINASTAMQLAKQQHKGLKVYETFVVNLIVLSVYEPLK